MESNEMKRVYKYALPTTRGEFALRIPKNSDTWEVKVQRGQPVLYVCFRGDPDDCEEIHFYCAYTGEILPIPGFYHVGTAILGEDDDYVLHYFDTFEEDYKRWKNER